MQIYLNRFRLLLVSTGLALAALAIGPIGIANASEPPAPEVTGVSPDQGPRAGGTTVVIDGANFTGATAVEFGPREAESFTVDSDSEITAVAPPSSGPGEGQAEVQILVQGPGGLSKETPADRFAYTPVIDDITPSYGPAIGGAAVTLHGFGLGETSAVEFGSVPSLSFAVNPDGTVTAIAPPETPRETIVPVRATTPEGVTENFLLQETNPANYFTYGPTVTSVDPNEGSEAGGTLVTIHGTGFDSPEYFCLCPLPFVHSVSFGSSVLPCGLPFGIDGFPCSPIEFEVKSETEIVAITPPGTGTVGVGVHTHGGPSPADPAAQFTYAPTEIAPEPLPEGEAKMLQLSCAAPRRLGRGEVSRACSSRSVQAWRSAASGPIKARLYRGHALYARGTANLHAHRARLLLKTLREVKPGRYALVLSSSRDSSRFPRREVIFVR